MRTLLLSGWLLAVLGGCGGAPEQGVEDAPATVGQAVSDTQCPKGTTFCSGTCGGGACLVVPEGGHCPTIPTCW